MATVISNSKVSKHNVDKYNFKVLALGSENSNDEFQATSPDSSYTKESHPDRRVNDVDSSALSNSSKDSLIESLMQKTDEMSSNFIKLQMKLEAKDEEYAYEIKKAKEVSFAEGVEAGIKQASKDIEAKLSNGVEQFATSVTRLEESAKLFEVSLENIKSDLILAAIDIAREVVTVEVTENSNEIAKSLSDELIKDLQSASKITLRVNPKDHGAISEHVGSLEHIQIISDSAVSEGGVVAISDAGNIDAQISKRFQRVKKVALSE